MDLGTQFRSISISGFSVGTSMSCILRSGVCAVGCVTVYCWSSWCRSTGFHLAYIAGLAEVGVVGESAVQSPDCENLTGIQIGDGLS